MNPLSKSVILNDSSRNPPQVKYKGWARMFFNGRDRLAKMELTANECHVLLLAESHLGIGNVIGCSQAKIARTLKIDPSNVSRAFAKLEKKGVFVRRGNKWLIHHSYALYGNEASSRRYFQLLNQGFVKQQIPA